ncbi:MAG TPA: TatD family hydrolase [Stellaceae bacterium]|jgi:TatD DNase family protein|nr:TatD family hydrolase [Stellaceae bacterium]
MLVDSHCHLDFATEDERAGIIARARGAGVRTLLTISTKLHEFAGVRAIAESDPDIWCSVGVHPHEAEIEPAAAEALIGLTNHPKVVGIGETGLDFYYEHSPCEQQAQVFRAHLTAARETGLPIIVHTRDADPETIAILQEEKPPAGVIHCFSTGRELAERAVAMGFYISISGIATFKNAQKLRDIIRDLPLERLLVETDAPYLAPVPMRGKTNEPAFVVHTAALVAQLKGVTLDELARVTSENFFKLFTKAQPPVAGS